MSQQLARITAVLATVSVSLFVASALHLAGAVGGRGTPFDADHAGVAEALLGVVLLVTVAALWRRGHRAVRSARWAVGFVIAGFAWGLSITARGGHWPDIAYHLVGIPTLLGCLVGLWQADRRSAISKAGPG